MIFDCLASLSPSAVAIGDFDGVHLGHAAVMAELRHISDNAHLTPVALTFDINTKNSAVITTPEQKRDLLIKHGAAQVLTLDFAAVKGTAPEVFAASLISAGVKAVVCGSDFRFGKDRTGNAVTMKSAGLNVIEVPPVIIDGAPVSSTRIRRAIADGDTALVAKLIGR